MRATPPFVKVVNNSGLIVQRGDSGFLTKSNLSIETNLNAFGPRDIIYTIKKGPVYGVILKDDVPVTAFTAVDLTDECIEYRHNNSAVSRDVLDLEVTVRDGAHEAEADTRLVFHIYPESYWEPLAIASNNSLLVEESTSIAITRYDLRVEGRSEMSPQDIIYMVKRPPMYGYLEIDPASSSSSSGPTTKSRPTTSVGGGNELNYNDMMAANGGGGNAFSPLGLGHSNGVTVFDQVNKQCYNDVINAFVTFDFYAYYSL